MKKIKDWFRKHNRILKDILESIIVMLLGVLLFFEGYCFGIRDGKTPTASASSLAYEPTGYHYPLKVGVTVDTVDLLFNITPNAVTNYAISELHNGLDIGLLCNYDNLYNDSLYPIDVTFNGEYNDNTPIDKIQFEAKYFQYVAYPLLDGVWGVTQNDIQNSYAFYFNDTMRNSALRVYCSYQYNIVGNERVNFVKNQTLTPYSLTTALTDYPSQYSKNAFTLFPTQPFGSPSFEGVHLVNPFKEWDENEQLPETFKANIYNFSLTIELRPFVTGSYVDENWHRLTYCSYLYDYSADFPTVIVTDVSWLESVANSVDSFLSIEILPNISFYDILILAIVIPLLLAILIAWLGG